MTGSAINAITTQLGEFNTNSYTPSSNPNDDFRYSIESAFLGASNYTSFMISSSRAEEGGGIGFKHTDSVGGVVLLLNNRGGVTIGHRGSSISSWTWRTIFLPWW